MGIAVNQVARVSRARWRLRSLPEKYRCLESPEPRVQLQAALKQIEALLHRNMQLLETVFLLNQALGDAHSLIHNDSSIGWTDRDKLLLSADFYRCMEQLCGEVRKHALE